MVSFDLDFFPRDDVDIEDYRSQIDWFLPSLSHNGNIVGDWQICLKSGCVQARVLSWMFDSLDERNLSIYARDDLEKLAVLSRQPPEFSSHELSSETRICHCQKLGKLLLYTHYPVTTSPIECLDCRGEVPFYRLPHINEEKDHGAFFFWKRSYEALDLLWLHSNIGERFATRQLERPKSDFMKRTRELAAALEEKSGVPTYSFLKHYYEKWGKRCPLCKRKWTWKDSSSELLAFKCDHCRLLSSEASDERTPLSKLHP